MPDPSTRLRVAALVLAILAPLAADIRPAQPHGRVDVDESGLPILEVRLADPARPHLTRTFRFLLDTGTSACVIDERVPAAFFWEEPFTARITDINGASRSVPLVLLKRVETGGFFRDNVPACRADLRGGVPGLFQDEPVDGILGMSFLRGTRFLLELDHGRIRWWPSPVPAGAVLPIGWSEMGDPLVTVRSGGREGQLRLDTGCVGGITLPWARPSGIPAWDLGARGGLGEGTFAGPGRVEAGGAAWKDVPLWHREAPGPGTLGLDILGAAPVYLDFINDKAVLAAPGGELAFRKDTAEFLSIRWDRTPARSRLVVHHLSPGSALARSGAEEGDEILEADGLEGPALSRRGLADLVRSGKARKWRVLRRGEERSLDFAPLPAPSPRPSSPPR